MSVFCGVECFVALGCLRWAWRRCTYIGGDDSATWPIATPDEFQPVPRLCRLILAVYEEDLRNPKILPPNHSLNPDHVIKRVTYEHTLGQAPPYLIYVDHAHKQIVLAIRGLNLIKESDYKLLLDNRLGMQMFDGGYVHHGLLKSATWVLNQESETLRKLWVQNGSGGYGLVFAGHSLGSGVAALMTVIVVNHRNMIGGIPREMVRCYSLAPARCMSLNLAVKYADVIYSIVLQDDFLPRTPTPLEDIFKSVFCLPCLLFLVCLRDTFIPEGRKIRDPRRLYAPGRIYHIVERKFCRCGRYPPEVRTAIPVDGRFEHIVLSCNATSDHGIIWIEREAEKALEVMKERSSETITTPPKVQRLDRLHTIEKEHKDALERAVSLNIPHAVNNLEDGPLTSNAEESSSGNYEGDSSTSENKDAELSIEDGVDTSIPNPTSTEGLTNWDDVVERLFERTKSGRLLRKPDTTDTE